MVQQCKCAHFGPLELRKEAIEKRIKDTKEIKKTLDTLSQHPSGEHRLLRCRVCNQVWQESKAGNWDNKEYVFQVPDISVGDWLSQPYVSPERFYAYNAALLEFLNRNTFTTSGKPCKREGCRNQAVIGLVQCLPHHIGDLQKTGALPSMPEGRWFPPYELGL